METKRTSAFENGLIWFGAAVSIAEILTGTYFAPLGLGKGLLAILVGHIIGCGLLFFAGLIGAKTRKSAMDTVKRSFGQRGSLLFSLLNILQLVGNIDTGNSLISQLIDNLHKLVHFLQGQGRCGLIQNEDAGIGNQRSCDTDQLLHTGIEAAHAHVHVNMHSQRLHGICRFALQLFPVDK